MLFQLIKLLERCGVRINDASRTPEVRRASQFSQLAVRISALWLIVIIDGKSDMDIKIDRVKLSFKMSSVDLNVLGEPLRTNHPTNQKIWWMKVTSKPWLTELELTGVKTKLDQL